LETNGPPASPRQPSVLEAENTRLRAENERLRMEREILKKATAFFAKESR
jgi:transposase